MPCGPAADVDSRETRHRAPDPHGADRGLRIADVPAKRRSSSRSAGAGFAAGPARAGVTRTAQVLANPLTGPAGRSGRRPRHAAVNARTVSWLRPLDGPPARKRSRSSAAPRRPRASKRQAARWRQPRAARPPRVCSAASTSSASCAPGGCPAEARSHASAILPVTTTSRGRPCTATVAVASSVSSPRNSPALSCSRTASSISRWAVTPSVLRNFRTDMLKTSSSTLVWLPFAHGAFGA